MLSLVLAAALAVSAAAFEACVTSTSSATLLNPTSPAFADAVAASVFPAPAPGYVVKVACEADVAAVVKCAVASAVPVCMRSGGHSFSGRGSGGPGCAMIDVLALKDFSYDAEKQLVTLGAGSSLGDMFFKTFEASGRVIGIGLCPSVGMAGYILGGGFGPFSSSLGLTCEAAQEFRFVLADGRAVVANAGENKELFWAACGGGGGSFGVMTSAVMKTAPSARYNDNVYFRYEWPKSAAGEVAHKHATYDDVDASVWVRVELSSNDGAIALGVCWDAECEEECVARLETSAFFGVGGKVQKILNAGADVTEAVKFLGPAGSWAREIPTLSNAEAFLNRYADEAGLGLKRSYSSMFTSFANGPPPQSVYDAVAAALFTTNAELVPFNLVQLNPWRGGEKGDKPQNAFAHRSADQLLELIGGNDGAEGDVLVAALAELERVHSAIIAAMLPWRSGVYVNYPDNKIADDAFPGLYYGSSLPRLEALRTSVDPTGVFVQKQQIGDGGVVRMAGAKGHCEDMVGLEVRNSRVEGRIQAYPFGILSGVRAEVRISEGCGLGAPKGAGLSGTRHSGVYEVVAEGGREWSLEMVGENCEMGVVSVNRIACPV